ncbi:MAG TPA: homoserine kinase [Bdellovibrionota bacterium]|nr:homoserine kinase [Bdellovibrionota bacterium]
MIKITVPASTSNLGSGFDTLGLSLNLYQTIEANPSDRWNISVSGRDAEEIPRDQTNLILEAYEANGGEKPFALHIQNDIPIGKGLGSSAVAIIAGIVLAHLQKKKTIDKELIFEKALQIENHPDNLAASIFGGLQVATTDSEGKVHHLSGPIPQGTNMSLIVPATKVNTKEARKILPHSYSLPILTQSLGRIALLLESFHRREYSLLKVAMADEIHQPYRAEMLDGLPEVLGMLQKDKSVYGATISGAGPSLFLLTKGAKIDSLGQITQFWILKGERITVIPVEVDMEGVQWSC